MTARRVLRMGDPRLMRIAEPVMHFDGPELAQLVRDMLDTMVAEDGAGLAAPQIGVGLRVVVFGFHSNPRYPGVETVPETVLINPSVLPLTRDTEAGWEGCLSVPGLRGLVPRFTRIRYSGFDLDGRRFEREAEGFHARVVQHETDHLDGVLYPQRMADIRTLGFIEELMDSGTMTTLLPCEDDDPGPESSGS